MGEFRNEIEIVRIKKTFSVGHIIIMGDFSVKIGRERLKARWDPMVLAIEMNLKKNQLVEWGLINNMILRNR